MNISFENKLRLGFIGNLVIVALSGTLFLYTTKNHQLPETTANAIDLVILSLIGVSMVLLSGRAEQGRSNCSYDEGHQSLQTVGRGITGNGT